MKSLYTLFILILLAGSVTAAETRYSQPLINATADEPVNLSTATLRNSASVAYSVNITSITGGSILPPSNIFLQRLFIRPARWLENELYTLSLRVSDAYGNAATADFPFFVNATGQRITLVAPEYGGTDNASADFVIQTEYVSSCKWLDSSNEIRDENLFSLIMNDFDVADGRQHTIRGFFNAMGVSPLEDLEVTVSVTCSDSGRLTSKLFYITYITEPPTVSISNTPDPIVDPYNPVSTVTVQADQEVWCTGNSEEWFGPRTIDSFNRQLVGTYTDHAPIAPQKNFPIFCVNRIGRSTTAPHTFNFNYHSVADILVTTPAFTSNAQYELGISLSKSSSCTVAHGTTMWTVAPQGFATAFTATAPSNQRLSEGPNTLNISCTTGFQSQPTLQSFTVTLDSVRPTNTITARPNSCSLDRLSFSFNSTDPTPSSGIASYNYTVLERTRGTTIIPWTNTDNQDVTIRNLELRNGTEYSIRGIAIDVAGNPSQQDDEFIKATDGTEPSCDTEPPEGFIYSRNLNGTTYAYLICNDNNGCQSTNYCNIEVGIAQTCAVDSTDQRQRYTNSTGGLLIDQPSTVCCEISDLSGNTAFVKSDIRLSAANESSRNETQACSNGELDEGESDVDCGGFFCSSIGNLCGVDERCTSSIHCESGVCNAGTCSAPSCTDNVKNGAETGVDCGGTCGACGALNSCNIDSNCGFDERCERGVCVAKDELQGGTDLPDPSTEEPLTPAGGFGLLNIILIVAGALSLISGAAYIVVYEEPRRAPQNQQLVNPFASLDEKPLVMSEPIQSQSTQAIRSKRRNLVKERVKAALKDFDSPEELTNKDTVTHRDIEQAYSNFDTSVFKEATQKLLDSKKIDKHNVAIALADVAAKKDANSKAIDELRKHFNLADEETNTQDQNEQKGQSIPGTKKKKKESKQQRVATNAEVATEDGESAAEDIR